jgi:hypothetical protein
MGPCTPKQSPRFKLNYSYKLQWCDTAGICGLTKTLHYCWSEMSVFALIKMTWQNRPLIIRQFRNLSLNDIQLTSRQRTQPTLKPAMLPQVWG